MSQNDGNDGPETPLVLMSVDEYQHRLLRGREVFTIETMPNDVIEAIRAAKMDESLNYLNDELGS